MNISADAKLFRLYFNMYHIYQHIWQAELERIYDEDGFHRKNCKLYKEQTAKLKKVNTELNKVSTKTFTQNALYGFTNRICTTSISSSVNY